MIIPTIEQLRQECETAAQSIDYVSPEWAAIRRYLDAKRWLIALETLAAKDEPATIHERGRASLLSELLRLREQFGASVRD